MHRIVRNLVRALMVVVATGIAFVTFAGFDPTALPSKILSGYSGAFLGHPEQFERVKRTLDDMSKAGFNSYDCKIQQSRLACDLDSHVAEVADMVQYANERDIVLQFYLYPVPFDGKRNDELAEFRELPHPIDANGIELKNQFMIADARVWKKLFYHAYQFARHRREIPFAALKFDIETIPWVTSYDDATWRRFCAEDPRFDAATPILNRHRAVLEKGADYERFFVRMVAAAVKEFVDELHAIDKTMSLGYMPAREGNGGYADVFDVVLATPDAPAVIDGWDMYNGGGYRQKVKDHADNVKRRNPNNRFVCWFRINSYEAQDMTSSAYHTAANVDGYSMWSMSMLTGGKVNSDHQLPKGMKPCDYFKAFGMANMAVRADIAEGKAKCAATMTRIPYVEAKPLVAPLSWESLKVPALKPVGDGTGQDRSITLRDPRTVFIHAQAGQSIRVTLSHLAGEARPLSLQYALLDGKGTLLRNEAVNPGATETFAVVAPETGTYALRVSGGSCGQAWYSVNVAAPLHWAVDARDRAYLFEPQTFYVVGSGVDGGNPTLRIRSSAAECFRVALNDGGARDVVRTPSVDIALPSGVVKVACTKSPVSDYAQNFQISFPGGGTPLVFPVRERRLEFVK